MADTSSDSADHNDSASAARKEVLPCSDALARTALETCRQHERLSRLMLLEVSFDELRAAHAMVETIDLALEESVAEFEKKSSKSGVTGNSELRAAANTMWLAARQYLRRHSMAERASRQIHRGDDSLGALHLEYQLEASSLLALRQATSAYQKLRPENCF